MMGHGKIPLLQLKWLLKFIFLPFCLFIFSVNGAYKQPITKEEAKIKMGCFIYLHQKFVGRVGGLHYISLINKWGRVQEVVPILIS